MPTCQITMHGTKSRVGLVGWSAAANGGNELTGAQAEPTTKWQKCIDVTYLGNEISIANLVPHLEQQPVFFSSIPSLPYIIEPNFLHPRCRVGPVRHTGYMTEYTFFVLILPGERGFPCHLNRWGINRLRKAPPYTHVAS